MKFLLYMHGGSGNKGCEAIVRSTIGILNNFGNNQFEVASWNVKEDINAGLDKICSLFATEKKINGIIKFIEKIEYKLFKTTKSRFYFENRAFYKRQYNIDCALSIGGDNYCYPGGYELCHLHNKYLQKQGIKCILWGCSIENSKLTNRVIEDLKKYKKIFARESFTYNNLIMAGLENVVLYPDPAFTLDTEKCSLPNNFNDVVGINLSPYALSGKIAWENYCTLIDYILNNTSMRVALIPHVSKKGNDDNECLLKIKSKYNDSRVMLIPNQENCKRTKYIISKCRFFVGARTHATIAAYSTSVPTIVLGYSVKSKGIARDIFGDDENYILSVYDFKDKNDLKEMFCKLMNNEKAIKKHYSQFMKQYIEKAFDAGKMLLNLIYN